METNTFVFAKKLFGSRKICIWVRKNVFDRLSVKVFPLNLNYKVLSSTVKTLTFKTYFGKWDREKFEIS